MLGRIQMSPVSRNCGRMLTVFVCFLLISSSTQAEDSPNDSALEPGHGYLLHRLLLSRGERIRNLEVTNLDTGDVVRTTAEMYKPAGPNAWMSLVSIPAGRYFWSNYQPEYVFGIHRTNPVRTYVLQSPRSPDDVFEIAPGAINYAGDWTVRYRSGPARWPWLLKVELDIETLKRFVVLYPDQAYEYEIYLSMMGKKAISLMEFQKIVEENSISRDK